MRLQLSLHRFSHQRPMVLKIISAGIVTGCIATIAPEILGLGYDTVNLALEGKIVVHSLLIILMAKIIATAFSIAMGMPGGLIGPQLFIGACLGGIIGIAVNGLFPDTASNGGFYVLLGMAAMMGAVINAPLAALMAVLELTYNPAILLPSMLIIVVACVTTRQIFKCDGIFIEQLQANGKSLASSPTQQILSNVGVRSVMKTSFVESQQTTSISQATKLLDKNPLWIVIQHDHEQDNPRLLLRASDLASYIASLNSPTDIKNKTHNNSNTTSNIIDLLEISGQRFSLGPIHELSTLYEAQQQLNHSQRDALYVVPQIQVSSEHKILGIITRTTIENYYKQ